MSDALWLEIRHSVRRLRRSPGFSLTVVTTIALAIGANTTALSLLNATLLRTIGVRDADQLVAVSTSDTRTGQPGFIYLDAFTAFRGQQRSFSALSMYWAGVFRIQARDTAVDVGVEGVTPAYFDLVGARVAAGRPLTEDERDVAADATPVVISEQLWRRLFDGDSRMLGETFTVEGRPVTIVGVTAAGFSGLNREGAADLFVPVGIFGSLAGLPQRPVRARYIVGRLAPGVSEEQARAEVDARWPGIQAGTVGSLPPAVQASVRSQRITVESLATGFSIMRREYGSSFVVIAGLAALLVAIACVNLIGLMSARALVRRPEIAMSMALGAGRARVFVGFLLDGVLLAMCALAIALPLAWWSSHAITGMLSFARPLPFQRPMTPDGRVLAVTISVTMITGLLISLIPAWRTVNVRMADAVRGGRTVAVTLGRTGRLGLVTQVALSVVLVIGAGLFARMLSNLHTTDEQFRERKIVFARLARSSGNRAPLGQAYFHGLLQQLSAIPGVDSAAISTYFPAFLGFRGTLPSDRFGSDGTSEAGALTGLTEFVSPGFFRLFGIALLRGRDFRWDDDERAPTVVIVSETLASKLFPDGNVIGRRLRVVSGSPNTDLTIVGVVADAPIGNIREPHLAVAFRPMMQGLNRAQLPLVHVRVNGDMNAAKDAYVRAVESQGHHFVRGLFTLDEWMDFALLQERLIAGVSTSAAMLAVLLACIGIYGALAYAVTSRVREIGVRMALGASQTTVRQMIVRAGLMVAVPGVLIGIPIAVGTARVVRSQLYGVTPTDPPTIVLSTLVILLVGVVAAWVPALRASKVEPIDALRNE